MGCAIMHCLTTVAIVVMASLCASFNLDIELPIRHGLNDDASMFGFVVEQYRDARGNWLLVGAPEANTNQPEVNRPGAVYKCPATNETSQCLQIPFDTEGQDQYNGRQVSNKSLQWFGASLASSSTTGHITACAPRYVDFTTTYQRRQPIGTCFILDGQQGTPKKYYPCRTNSGSTEFNDVTLCQAGFSVGTEENHLVMGAVGSFFWQGRVIVQDVERTSQPQGTPEANYYSRVYEYGGYALTIGDFNGDGVKDIASSVPKSREPKGRVDIYTFSLRKVASIFGNGHVGEYFGFALASDDFNGDGRDDLVVGAPFYADEIPQSYDTGRVYIYYQTSNPSRPFADHSLIMGRKESGGRFGYAVSSSGDLNDDGFNDLAVGAPYGGQQGHGAVYIFQGSAQGVSSTFSQIIESSALGPSLRTLGFSLSGGMDQDNNLYPDLLVGAQESAEVVLFRARPVVKVSPVFSANVTNINLENMDCQLNGLQYTCFELQTCVSFSGKGTTGALSFQVVSVLDYYARSEPRVYFHTGSKQLRQTDTVIEVGSGHKTCKTSVVYINSGIRDKLRPIVTQIHISLLRNSQPTTAVHPILDNSIPSLYYWSIGIDKKCGADKVCIPDLKLGISSTQDELLFGNSTELELLVSVENLAEGAYESTLYINMPPDVLFVSQHSANDEEVVCTSITDDGSDRATLICDVGNPLLSNKTVIFALRFDTQNIDEEVTSLLFESNVNTTNPENVTTMDSNAISVEVNTTAEAQLEIQGVSIPGQVLFNGSHQHEETIISENSTIEPNFVHRYVITNRGPSTLSETVTEVFWPELLNNQTLLFYLTEAVVVKGDGQCQADIMSNETVAEMVAESDGVLYEFITSMFDGDPEGRNDKYSVGCSTAEQRQSCKHIKCTTGVMKQSDNIIIEVKGKVFARSMLKVIKSVRGVNATSFARATITAFPYSIKPQGHSNCTFQVETFIGAVPDVLQSWVIIAAAVGGVILLLIIVLILWKVGFFKRQKLDDEQHLADDSVEATGLDNKPEVAVPPSEDDDQKCVK